MRASRIIPTAIATVLAIALFTMGTVSKGSESNAKPAAQPTPTATYTLPACGTEDGAGQALCMWDAQSMGNGQGTTVVSGDCSLYHNKTRSLCLNVHTQGQEGVDYVQMCNDTDDNVSCIKEWLN